MRRSQESCGSVSVGEVCLDCEESCLLGSANPIGSALLDIRIQALFMTLKQEIKVRNAPTPYNCHGYR